MRRTYWPLMAAGFGLLGGCGGGGNDGGVNSTPAPPPAATPKNSSLTDLRYDQTLVGDSATSMIAFNLTSKTAISGTASRSALTVSYDAAAKSYTIAAPGRGQTFAPADIRASDVIGEVRYEKSDAANRDYLTLVTTPYTGDTANQYVGLGFWQRNMVADGRQDTLFDTFTYGLDTAAAAVPRTGAASFSIDVFGLATTPGYEPRVFQGRGTFDTDFMVGVFSTNTYLTESGLLSGNGISGGGIQLTGAGKLSGTDGTFSGNILYGGVNATVAGSMNGRFYGPASQEVGASFTAGNTDGNTVTGSLTGQRDTSNPAINLTLTNLVAPQFFYTQEALLAVNSFDGQTNINASTFRMISHLDLQTSDNLTYGPGRSSLPGGAFTTASQVTSADPKFTAYEKTLNEQKVRLELYKPGNGNRELALTYASFGRWSSSSRAGVVTETDHVHFVYGLETPAGLLSARTGSARYEGVAYGAGVNAKTAAAYDVSGTSRFNVDFSNQSYSGALALRGASTNGAAAVDFGSYDFAGKLSSTTADSSAALMQAGQNSGELDTRFFGPDGEEIGGPFTLTVQEGIPGAGTSIAGVTVANRQ